MTFPLVLLLSALSGFVALSSELVWFRAWSFASGAAAASFGALLGFYLLGIAGGSAAAGRLCGDRDAKGLAPVVRAVSVSVLAAALLGFLVVPGFGLAARLGRPALGLPVVALVTLLMGAVFPLLSHAGIAPDERTGARVSYVYVANIVGSAAGSLLTGFVLMDRWTLRGLATAVALAGSVLGAGVGLLACPHGGSRRGSAARAAMALGAASVLVLLSAPLLYRHIYERMQLGARYDPSRPFAHVVETRSGVITVTDDGQIFGGGAYDGRFHVDLREDSNGIHRCLALAAMHPGPRDVLMVGLSSGSWARVVAAFPTVRRLTIVEINPGYLQLLRAYPGGGALLDDPKVEIVIDDGRRWLQRHPGARFDLIVQNTTWHWRAHITNLLSREYLELVRGRLAAGGLFYFNTTFSAVAQKTAVTVFPHAWRDAGFVAVSDAPIDFDKVRWRRVMEAFRLDGRPFFDLSVAADRALLDALMARADDVDGPRPDRGLETRPHMLARLAATPVVTDDNMLTEW